VSEGRRNIEVKAPPEAVWNALVAEGRNNWYFQLDVEGAFEPGSRVVWKGGGEVVEEADVVAAERPHRLEIRSHFLWAPYVKAEPPHAVTWEIEPCDGGSKVTLSWKANLHVARMFEREGLSVLKGLRLALDPEARAELARLPAIGDVTVLDVTPDRVGDYQSFFDHDAFRDFPSWETCYCMETHRTQDGRDWEARTGADNRRDMSEMIGNGHVTALLAYVDGKPVGWCNYGETTRLKGVMMKLKLDATEHDKVGSIACFVIASPYRGHGVATKLLDAAVDRLKARGVRVVEAYPRRQDEGTDQAHYRGSLRMYEKAGFEPYRELDRYVVVRKTLA
jgi:ribosomal protein S18 acetylase RimI-like enzyme/uncharacterized protein YndB with AHSA1/START domain